MFTGIVEELGVVKNIAKRNNLLCLGIFVSFASEVEIGDSISINGTCLTVVKIKGDMVFFDAVSSTIKTTTIGSLKLNDKVNIEQALKVGAKMGGHVVTGHIDTIGSIRNKNLSGGQAVFEVAIDKKFIANIVEKGSIAIDGISLTVREVKDGSFIVNIIPHTLKETTLSFKKQGDKVNIELDILSKYKDAGANGCSPLQPSRITEEYLKEHGFLA